MFNPPQAFSLFSPTIFSIIPSANNTEAVSSVSTSPKVFIALSSARFCVAPSTKLTIASAHGMQTEVLKTASESVTLYVTLTPFTFTSKFS